MEHTPGGHICQDVYESFFSGGAEVGKVFDMEMFFAALADRTRLRLINLMSVDEMCVCFFVEVLGTNQPQISRHLAYLRRSPTPRNGFAELRLHPSR